MKEHESSQSETVPPSEVEVEHRRVHKDRGIAGVGL